MPPPSLEGDVIELFWNNWNDYGYQTSFPTTCRIKGKLVELGLIRLLVDGKHYTCAYLDQLLAKGWDGVFPIPDTDYISIPSEIAFYEQLEGAVGYRIATRVAKALHDASYLVRVVDDETAKRLVETEGFKNSLQRERGSTKAYLDGWKILERQAIAVLDLGFRYKDIFGKTATLNLKFQADSPLPHDVNVLIGANGSGKSRVLHQMVDDWMTQSKDDELGFISKPNLNQLVVVSYSPFERFPVDYQPNSVQDSLAYRYFGFRGRSAPSESNKRGKIRLSHDFPKSNAAEGLVACLSDDKRYRAIRDWAHKVKTVERVLLSAFDFDFAAVDVSASKRPQIFYSETDDVNPLSIEIGDGDDLRRFIPITSGHVAKLKDEALRKWILPKNGVTFFKNGSPVELSSGQRLFAYIVINILGVIRRNSLILVDEPELYLHPTLEIQFVDMLKKILSQFNSKALLATHSLVTVREIPADCVHVFERTDDNEVVVKHPPFQTFGGDVQRISSYVFGDRSVSKPFERWIAEQIEELGSGGALLEALGDELNEELIVQIKAMERGQW
jgi:energy-coupling factor transporter ATP-binding protein EcfA2